MLSAEDHAARIQGHDAGGFSCPQAELPGWGLRGERDARIGPLAGLNWLCRAAAACAA